MTRARDLLAFALTALLVVNSVPYIPAIAAAPTFKLTYNASNVAFSYPEDLRILRNVTVTNLENSYFEFMVVPHFYGNNVSLSNGIVFPQGAGLVLHPFETQTVSVMLDLTKIAPTWHTGLLYLYNIGLEIGPITKGPGCTQPTFCIDHTRSQVANLSDSVNVLCTCFNLKPNTSVSGQVFDKATARPIPGAHVAVQGTPLNYSEATTGIQGFYNISLTGFRSTDTGAWAAVDLHVTVPNSTYASSDVVIYPQPGISASQDFLLGRQVQNSTYSVFSKFRADGGLNLGRGVFSGNGSYFAAATFATGSASQANVLQNSSLYFFSSNGTMLWKRPTNTTTSAVDVSDDAKYVATAGGTQANPRPQYAEVFTTAGKLTWSIDATNVPGSKPNLSLYWTPDQWSTVKFSHDGSMFAAGTSDGFLFLFTMANRAVVFEKFLSGTIDAIRFSADNSVVYVSSANGYVYAMSTTQSGGRAPGSVFWQTYAYGGANGFGFGTQWIVISPRTGNYIELLDQSGTRAWTVPVEATYPNAKIALNQQYVAFFGDSPFPYSGLLNISGNATVLWGPATTGAISLDAKYVLWAGLLSSSPGTTSVVLYDTSGHALLNYTDSTDSQPGCGGGPSWVGSQETRITVVACDYVYFLAGYLTTTFANSVNVAGQSYQVPVVSNSTISNFFYNPSANAIGFNSSLGSRAYFKVTIPSAVLSGNLSVIAGGKVIPANVTTSSSSTTLSFVCGYKCGSILIAANSSSTTTTTTTTSTTSTTTVTSNTTSTNSTTTIQTATTSTVTVTQPGSGLGSLQSSGLLIAETLAAAVVGGIILVLVGLRRRGSIAKTPTQASSSRIRRTALPVLS